jgi:hypothetical protein
VRTSSFVQYVHTLQRKLLESLCLLPYFCSLFNDAF